MFFPFRSLLLFIQRRLWDPDLIYPTHAFEEIFHLLICLTFAISSEKRSERVSEWVSEPASWAAQARWQLEANKQRGRRCRRMTRSQKWLDSWNMKPRYLSTAERCMMGGCHDTVAGNGAALDDLTQFTLSQPSPCLWPNTPVQCPSVAEVISLNRRR